MIFEHSLQTQNEGFIDITNEVRNAMQKSGVQNGISREAQLELLTTWRVEQGRNKYGK